MRSVLLSTLDFPPRKGGVATYLANLAACFPRGTFHVLAPEEGDTHAADVRSDFPIYRRRMLGRWLRPRWLAALYWTDWLRRKEKCDFLLVSHVLPMGVAAAILKRWTGLRYGVIVHGMDVALAMEAGGGKLARAKRVLAGADIVVANSAYTAHLVAGMGVAKEKITVVRPSPGFPLFLTVPADRTEAVRKQRWGERAFAVLSVGRLVKRKGFDTVITAIAALADRGVDAGLCIVGDGPERKALEKLAAEKGVADRVVFAGQVSDEDLPPHYAAADVFAMVPRSIGADVEGFGIVYLEANLMGAAVVGSRAGGVPDAVVDGRTGLLVDPGDAGALAAALERLAKDRALRESLGAQGRQRVIDEFGWRRQAKPLVDLLLAME